MVALGKGKRMKQGARFQIRVCVEGHEWCYAHAAQPGFEGYNLGPGERVIIIDGSDLAELLSEVSDITLDVDKITLKLDDKTHGVKIMINEEGYTTPLGRDLGR